MAAFDFVALDALGRKQAPAAQKKDVLEADSARQIRQQLRDQARLEELLRVMQKG